MPDLQAEIIERSPKEVLAASVILIDPVQYLGHRVDRDGDSVCEHSYSFLGCDP